MLFKSVLVAIAICGSIYPQVVKQEVYKVTSTERKISEIRQLSNSGSALIIETENNLQNYYLVNLFDQREKKLLFSSPQGNRESIRFSENSRFITFSTKDANRYIIKVYDTFDGTVKEINDPDGDVVYASIVNENNILYEIVPPRDYPKIYMLNEDFSNPKFIGDGTTPKWSPDGNWFLARKAEYDKSKTKSKRVKMLGYEIVKKPIYSIYDYYGQKILDIKNHEKINFIQWSPSSDKILFTKLNSPGFFIIYLKITNNSIEVEKEYHFDGFAKEGENIAYVDNPNWAPKGEWISFIKSVGDGNSIFESSVYIHNIYTHKQLEVTNFPGDEIQQSIWISDYELLTMQRGGYKSNEKYVIKTNIAVLKNN